MSKNNHEGGVTVQFRKVANRELNEIARSLRPRAIYDEGAYGPFTIQCRQDKHGAWKAQEMNLRANGNTFSRFLLGQDDLGIIINHMLPQADFPVYHGPPDADRYIIQKIPHCHIMHTDDVRLWSLTWCGMQASPSEGQLFRNLSSRRSEVIMQRLPATTASASDCTLLD